MIIPFKSSDLQDIICEFELLAQNLSYATEDEKFYILGAICALLQRRY